MSQVTVSASQNHVKNADLQHISLEEMSMKIVFYMFRGSFSEVYDSSQIIGHFTKTSQISSSPVECLLKKCEKFKWILLTCSRTRNLEEKRFYLLKETKQAKQPRSTWAENTVLGKNCFEREHRENETRNHSAMSAR